MKLFNSNAINRLNNELYPIAPNLVERLIKSIYEDAYQRGQLTIRERHIATLASLISMGGAERQLSFQGYAAFRLGFTQNDLEEILIQCAAFCGFTRAINAAVIFNQVKEKFENGLDDEA